MDFDTMALPYLGTPMTLSNMPAADYLTALQPMDIPPHHPPYDHDAFASGDDMSFSQASLSHPLRRFSNHHHQQQQQYEEPFPELLSPYDAMPPEQLPPDASVDHNHKLLSFSLPAYNFTLLDYSLRRTSLSMSAQLHGMFFLAESPWTTAPSTAAAAAAAGDASLAPPIAELTCYRRNLFQITGSVTLPRSLRYIMTDQGDRIPILAHELTVSATESVEGNPVKIISVPWKTPANNATTTASSTTTTTTTTTSSSAAGANAGAADDKATEKEPPAIPLDTMAGQDIDSDYATFSIAWKRLQFRIATANNGRRKELQQHFIVRLKIVATLSTGAKIAIAEAHSGPVIVRGRSPRNFQSRKDLPLSGSAAASRKNAQAAALQRANNNSNTETRSQQAASKRSKSPPEPSPAPVPLKLDSSPKPASDQQTLPPTTTAAIGDWKHIPATASTSTPILSSSTPFSAPPPATTSAGPSTSYSQSSPDHPRPGKRRRTSANTRPQLNLSLMNDDCGPCSPATPTTPIHPSSGGHPLLLTSTSTTSAPSLDQHHHHQQQHPHTYLSQSPYHPVHPATTAGMPSYPPYPSSAAPHHPLLSTFSPHIVNPNDTADLLYEYFPLGLDDWQAPVDAVYRPHVVHHMHSLPDDPKAIAARNRGKRYFAEGS